MKQTDRTNTSRSIDSSHSPFGVQNLSWSDDAADQIRRLSPSEKVILFTPVVPPPRCQQLLASSTGMTHDPFECLGQTLTTYCKRVNHVPFVPHAGMMGIHRDMVALASAIVVVNAAPEAVDPSTARSSLEAQRAFATAVALETVRHQGRNGLDLLPLVMLHCGSAPGQPQADGSLRSAYCDYDMIMHCKDYAFTALVEAGHCLMSSA